MIAIARDAGGVAAGSDRPAPRPRPRPRGAPRRRPSPSSAPSRSRLLLSLVTVALIYARPATTRALERPSRVTTAAQRPSSLAGLSLALRSRRRAGRAPRAGHDGRGGAPRRGGDRRGVQPSGRGRPAALRRGLRRARLQLVRRSDRRGDRAGLRWPGGHGLRELHELPDARGRADGPRPQRHADPWGERPDGARGGARAPRRRGGARRRHRRSPRASSSATRCRCSPAPRYPVVRRPRRCRCASSGSRRSPPSRSRGRTRHGSASARSSPDPPSNSCSAPTRTCPSGPPRAWRRAPTRRSSSTPTPTASRTPLGVKTRWFTDARPAELLQLDEASPVLAGAIAVALLLLVAVLAQGAWSRTRASAAELSVLQALGCSRSQLARIAAWQTVPPGLAALAVGRAARDRGRSTRLQRLRPLDRGGGRPELTALARRGAGAGRRRVGRSGRAGGRTGRRATSPAPPPSATPKAAAPDVVAKATAGQGAKCSGMLHSTAARSQVCRRSAVVHGPGQRGRVEAVDELGHRHGLAGLGQARGWPPGGCGPRPRRRPRRRGRRG